MTDQILATKLHLPILRNDIVPRRRLVERLNEGLLQQDGFVRKLTLISAPAGFGKTTLVSEWLRGSELQTAWLSLDESDNDPARFLAYLIAAVRQIRADFGDATWTILQLPQPPPPNVILTSLVNELSGLNAPFILALDDYHTIHTLPIHQQLTFILENQPANMHLILLSREDPLLPIARLRARRQLLEIRQDDLRFTHDETAELLQRGSGLSLGVEDITALENRTEGWAAGLQLMALSLRGCDDLQAFIQTFTGSHRYILDYLTDEVFVRQPPEIQEFLLQTCILKQLSGPLCDAVTGGSGSAEVLASLEGANLFIIPLDLSRNWYRYHHLFAELLRHRLRQGVFSEANLHRRAGQWYEGQGFFKDAVEHLLAAQDWEDATRLIAVINDDMLKLGEVVTLLNWFDKIPLEITCSNPDLCMIYAWAALLASQLDTAGSLLERAEQLAEPGSNFLGQVAAAQAYLARAEREEARAIEKSEQALALLPEKDIGGRGNIALNLGLAYWHEGRMAEAEPVLAQAGDLCGKSGNFFALLTAQIFQARIAAVRGKLRQAAAALEKMILNGRPIPILCLAHYDLAALHHEWNNLPEACHHLEKGLELSQHSGNLEFQQAGVLMQAILAHAQGDHDRAWAALAEADALAHDFPVKVRSRTAAFGVQMALARSDPQMISHWAERVNAEVDAHSFYRFMGLTRPRLLIAQGEKAEAAEALETLYKTASSTGWGYGLLVVRILQSLAANTTDEALQFVSDALHMGQPEGFIRSFVDAGSAVIPLLQSAARRGASPEYVDQILSAMGAERQKDTSWQESLIEPLSEREIEVLQLVTAGLSNREIASRLFITPGTAKTHVHNLCGKLGVRNRTEAAVRARELGLV
jgi:LuxR family maltose regulon positive regulatory protein